MPDPLAKPNRPKPNPLEGAALIIVLSCLVLLAALAIGLLNRVEADRANASAYRGSTLTRNLAEYAINVVMAQISAATKSDPTLAWASQPGAIRTYSATSTNLEAIYKLYSSTNMVASNASATNIVTGDVAALASWANNSALFTDLNAPVVSVRGTNATTNYPILDPSATNSVQGFAITGAPTTTTQPAPMPVNWLYVLEDGTLVPPTTAAGNNTVTVTGATAANPIVGRIAFWTDDDTSKININTASGAPWNFSSGTVTNSYVTTFTAPDPANFWDVPVMGSVQDANLALSQPWKGEYQRYPGHPATISLSAALPSLTSRSAIEALTPRVNTGGSSGGSVVNITPAALADDGARLYANVDELIYSTNRPTTGTLSATDIERARFFLTASSRAPDVTLFNTPRILCWPITSSGGSTTKMTPYDQLIAFCGTVGSNTNIGSTNAYYFTRWNPTNATVDYNANTRLLGYLQRMTEIPVPGFGGSGILSKYTTANEPAQIRTEIFDYIRCLNSQDTSVNNTYWYTPNANNAWIVPSAPVNGTRGFGRFPTVSKAALMFWGGNFITTTSGNTTTTNGIQLNAALLLENFTPALGWPRISDKIRIQVTGLTNLPWGTNGIPTSPIFHANTTNTRAFDSSKWGERPYGGRQGFGMLMDNISYPFLSTNVLSANYTNTSTLDGKFALGNGTITVQVGLESGSTNYVQTLQIYFPDATNIALPRTTNSSVWERNTKAANASTVFAVVTTNDVVRGVSVSHGDFRLTAARTNVSSSSFTNLPSYTNSTNLSHRLVASSDNNQFSGVTTNSYFSATAPAVLTTNSLTKLPRPMDAGIDLSTATALARGDWDNGTGAAIDGPYINWADEGNAYYLNGGNPAYPYFTADQQAQALGPSLFTPNRLMPSAGMFGSLPTGVMADVPWQTLLFRPAALTVASHPGLNTPPDYLLLDLFNMPVVEPYAITEPLSTAGRVNMNYQILPFTYIKRSTAVLAALHTERMTVLTTNTPTSYGISNTSKALGTSAPINATNRPTLNLSTNNGTLVGFEQRFGSNDIFRSAAEICSIPLVPINSTWSSVTNTNSTGFWATNSATGDNSKERPYARIYPKLTTKSNTYTVHYRVEVLKKSPNSATQTTWADGTDKVISTYRGATTIERYVNPRDPGLPDYASTNTLPPSGPNALPNFYKFRILGERQFNP